MALTRREKWDRFVDEHPSVTADAYYWCSGKVWDERRYCVVLVGKGGYRSIGLELRADTPAKLAKVMREVGCQATGRDVARMCHAAARSPRRPRRAALEATAKGDPR